MAKELLIGLTIGAALKGSFVSTFNQANKTLAQLGGSLTTAQDKNNRLGQSITKHQQKQIQLQQRISQAYAIGDQRVGKLVRRYERMQNHLKHALNLQDKFTQSIQKSEKAQTKLQTALAKHSANKAERNELKSKIVGSAASTAAVAMPIWSSVKSYMEQEEAANNLKIAMMKADGSVGKFNEISKIASELGKDLPGTTKDFYNLAQALKKQGISDDVLTNGALKTSAQLNVLLDMDQQGGGEFLAKFMESHRLSESELPQAADYLQRAMFAGGLSKEQMYESMKYYAPKLNSMKLTGAANTEKVLAIEAMAGQQGLEGSTFGTGLNMMLSRMNKGPEMMRAATKGMKAEAQDMVKAVGVSFEFWDKKGNFKGIDGMLAEMTKFEKIRAKFGDKGVGLVAEELFGIEGGRLADILAQKGSKGLEDMIAKMREQASLQDRIKQKTATLSSALESLGGVWESAVGTMGAAFAEDIKTLANWAQNLIENDLTPWLAKHKELVKVIGTAVVGFTAFSTVMFGLRFALSGVFSVFSGINISVKAFKALKMASELEKMGQVSKLTRVFTTLKSSIGTLLHWGGRFVTFLSGALVKGLGIAARAFMVLGRALLMNPIGLLITAIAVGAYLIYDNWSVIAPFFEQLWATVSSAFSTAWGYIQSAWSAVGQWVSSVWSGITEFFGNLWQQITTAFDGGIAGIGALILNWSPLGLFYQCFSAVLNWFGIELPTTFTGFGANIIDGLVNGIQNAWNAAKEMIGNLGDSIKGWFAEKLGIHSPSRVFAGFGENISQGLAIGIANSIVDAEKSVHKLGDKVKAAAPSSVELAVGIAQQATHLPQIGVQAVKKTQHFANPVVKPRNNAAQPLYKPTTIKPRTVQAVKKPQHFTKPVITQRENSEPPLAQYQPLARTREAGKSSTDKSQSIVVHFNPTIHVNGAQANQEQGIREQIMQALQTMPLELERVILRTIETLTEDRQRRAY